MENKNQKDTVEINILGVKYRVSSKEGEGNAYVKQAAEYVSSMYDKLKGIPGFTRRSKDYQNLMMYLNMADDYLRASEWTEERQLAANTDAENEIADLKKQLQDTVAQSMETENALRDEMVHLKKRVEYSFHERNHYMEQQRNTEAKMMALEKELSGYKTETSVIRRKMEEMRRDAEDAVKLRKEAATRTKDWEAAMLKLKNELTESYESKIRELTEGYENKIKELTALHENEVSEIKKQDDAKYSRTVADYEDRISEYERKTEEQIGEARAACVNKTVKFKAECDETIEKMQADCDKKCADTVSECEARISAMEQETKEAIEKTNATRDRMIATLKQDNEIKLQRMKTAQDAKISRIMQSVNDEKGDITAPFEKEIIEKEQELARRQKQLSNKEEELILYKDKLAEAEKKIASLTYKLQEAEIGAQ